MLQKNKTKSFTANQVEELDRTCSTKVCKKIKNQVLYFISGFFRNWRGSIQELQQRA
jgi:hypothetical protein